MSNKQKPVAVNRTMVFISVALALMMMSIDSTIVATVLHSLQQGLDTTINWAGWTITAYAFGFVVMLPISGKLSERYGKRKVFLVSVIVFTLASLFCGLATNIYELIALRALQAAGGAGFTPSATGIVVDHFGQARDRAVGLFGSIFPVGAMLGPIVGGVLAMYWSWRSVFYVNVPVGIIILVLSLVFIPPDIKRKKEVLQPDVLGIISLAADIMSLMLAASYLGEKEASPGSFLFLSLCIFAAGSLFLFFRHIQKVANPFIAPRLIYGKNFGVVNLINILYTGIPLGAATLIPLYAANRYGMDALDSGTLLTAQGAGAIILSLLATMALRRTGYRLPLYVGAGFTVVGMLWLAFSPLFGVSAYVWLAIGAFFIGAGSGFINPASRNAGLQLAINHASTLAAIRTLSLQIGQITSISLATAFLANVIDPGMSQVWLFIVVAVLLLACLPLIARIPEHKGAW